MAHNGLENQRWFRLDPTDTAVVSITGPDTLHLESRIIPIDSTSREASYLLRVSLDGEAHDWMRAVGRASRTVWADGMPVGKRVRASVFVPDGDHTITVSVDPSRPVTCLIRIRQIDPSMEDGI